ncbi:MAG: hypothetical protein O3C54_03695 [Proteobacteria bacterium]|nr:hypothetical protein [SAR86 cluster bacterium]MDA0345044.1 hypothetical protein [Pseudomonadota bacterium]MDA0899962.1 hypothetical protein [Pseudomonadota bacterium]MDA1056682.1 hypothetical protein [Pseudomonadota bacterium]
MNKAGLYFAYILIYTSPIQAGFILWQLWIVLTSDYTFFGLSTKEFLVDNLKFLHDWIYSWFWNALLDFFYQFPAVVMTTLKLVVNTWLGYWLLAKYK